MKQIAEQLRELGFERTSNSYLTEYYRGDLRAELFLDSRIYMIVSRPGKMTSWCGAHFPPFVPVAAAIEIVTAHHQSLQAAVAAAIESAAIAAAAMPRQTGEE